MIRKLPATSLEGLHPLRTG